MYSTDLTLSWASLTLVKSCHDRWKEIIQTEGKVKYSIYIYIYIYIHIYTWVRALWIEFNNCPTRCDLFSFLYFCRQLYMFRVLTPIIRSSYNCNYSFWYWLTGSTKIPSRCWVGTDSFVMHNKWIPTVRYTWISSNSTRAGGSRSG